MANKIKARVIHNGRSYVGLIKDRETWNALKAGAVSWTDRQRQQLTHYEIPADVYWDLFEKDRINGFDAKCCNHCIPDHDFRSIGDTVEYNGVETSLNDQGMLRVRVYTGGHLESQDMINVNFCPFCGRRFKNVKTETSAEQV